MVRVENRRSIKGKEHMIYTRVNDYVLFILPTVAIGVDYNEGKHWFLEIAWLNYVLGFGEANNE